MRPTYFAYDPKTHTQESAYEQARYFLASDSVIYVFSSSIMGQHFDPNTGPDVPSEYVLVQVDPDGSQLLI